jgi:hypothetical protein
MLIKGLEFVLGCKSNRIPRFLAKRKYNKKNIKIRSLNYQQILCRLICFFAMNPRYLDPENEKSISKDLIETLMIASSNQAHENTRMKSLREEINDLMLSIGVPENDEILLQIQQRLDEGKIISLEKKWDYIEADLLCFEIEHKPTLKTHGDKYYENDEEFLGIIEKAIKEKKHKSFIEFLKYCNEMITSYMFEAVSVLTENPHEAPDQHFLSKGDIKDSYFTALNSNTFMTPI